MNRKKEIELRIILRPMDPLYTIFSKIKEASGIKKNSEVLRFILKQVSNIPSKSFIEKPLSQTI